MKIQTKQNVNVKEEFRKQTLLKHSIIVSWCMVTIYLACSFTCNERLRLCVCEVLRQEHALLTQRALHCQWMVTQSTVAGAWRASRGTDTLSRQKNLPYWRRTWTNMRLGLQVITTILHLVFNEILLYNHKLILKMNTWKYHCWNTNI